jgi:hypothetical protein
MQMDLRFWIDDLRLLTRCKLIDDFRITIDDWMTRCNEIYDFRFSIEDFADKMQDDLQLNQ